MTGRVTISFDFELGWGSIETGFWQRREREGVYDQLRPVMQRLCRTLDSLELSLTWAVVGAAVEAADHRNFDHLPEDVKLKITQFTDNAAGPTKDARDLLELLQSMRIPQDIGSHSYSHTRFTWPEYSSEAKRQDILNSNAALSSHGIKPASFVFPLNLVGNHDLLLNSGITIARHPPSYAYSKLGKIWERAWLPPPSAECATDVNGLCIEKGSMLFTWGVNRDWKLRKFLTERQYRKGLSEVLSVGNSLHLWLHPFNLVEVPELETSFHVLLHELAELRDAERLSVVTMRDLVA